MPSTPPWHSMPTSVADQEEEEDGLRMKYKSERIRQAH